MAGGAWSAEAAAIARESQMRSEASEAARLAYVTQARTLRERRGSFIKMVVISALGARQSARAFVVQLVRLGFRSLRAW